MTEPYKAGPFLGINTKLPTDKLRMPRSASGGGGSYVRDAVNVDLTDVGSFERRAGSQAVVDGARVRCIWSDGLMGYFADNDKLYSFDGEVAVQVATLAHADANVSYHTTPRGVVWTDGLQLSLIKNGAPTPLVISPPNPIPLISAGSGGSLPKGIYLVAFATVSDEGERSALTSFFPVEVEDDGAIDVLFPAHSLGIQMFMTAAGGEQLYSQGVVPSGITTARLVLATTSGAPVADRYEAPMPAGSIVREYHGRLLTVVGPVMYLSMPYAYGIYHPTQNFIVLDGPITLCEPTETGVFLATAHNTWFADGPDIAKATLKSVAPYGAIPNSSAQEPNSQELWWFTPRGAVRSNGGELELKQDDNIAFGAAHNGASMFREANGLAQFVTVVSDVEPSGAARASAWVDAEVVNT